MMLTKLKQVYANFGFNLPLLLAFLLPFGINYAIIILIWAVCFLAFDNIKKSVSAIFKNKWSYILLSFFLIHVLAYFFSVNKQEALTSIEIKLSFLAFPILVFSSNYEELKIKKIVIAFVSACVLASIICLFRAFYLYIFKDVNAFFYSEFSYFLHPSYFAMYLVFAQLVVMLYYKKWLSHLTHLQLKIGFISIIFLICIFLCSSKMGLITAFLVLPATLFIMLFNQGYKKWIIVLSVSFLVVIGLVYKLLPAPFERIKLALNVTASPETIDKTDAESTAVRILIWKESVKIIKDNVLLGVTPGDSNDMLVKAYQNNGLTGALRKKLNAHNQFLQTWIGTGIVGFILLCIMTVFVFVYGLVKKNYILALFSILMIFNFMVESMLQAQAGFIFYAFFLCLLLRYDFSKFTSDNKLNTAVS